MRALDAAHAAATRLNGLPRDAPLISVTGWALSRTGTGPHVPFAGCSSGLTQLRDGVPAGVVLEPARPDHRQPKNGETLIAAVERLRVRSRPHASASMRSAGAIAVDDQRNLIVQAVAEKARTGRPTVRIVNDAAHISWGEGTSLTTIAVLDRSAADDRCAVGRAVRGRRRDDCPERNAAVSRLQDQLAELETLEAALLEYADANGVDILPRIDMSPPAFLGVVIAKRRRRW